ncbi:MAG: hypothetical protein QOE87_1545 [Gaiellales bacterium]|nr:hypothetical protein [Gaiellales bacterium]
MPTQEFAADGDRSEARPPYVPILLYHAVADAPLPGFEAYTVTRRMFSEHVRAVAASGRTALTISQVAAGIQGSAPWPASPVALRFDDGYDDTQQSVEELLGAGLGATVYVTTGTVGSRRGMTAQAVAELAGYPGRVEVGAHTISHATLDEISARRAKEEIVGSREMLEQVVGAAIASFAYPHGAFNRRVRQIVIDAGYLSAGAVKNALARTNDDVFSIPTWTVGSATPADRIQEVLEGQNVPLSWSHERASTTAYRWVRRLRRRSRTFGGA